MNIHRYKPPPNKQDKSKAPKPKMKYMPSYKNILSCLFSFLKIGNNGCVNIVGIDHSAIHKATPPAVVHLGPKNIVIR